MKYLMKYENAVKTTAGTPEPKFQKGQWVRIIEDYRGKIFWRSKPYKIVNYNFNYNSDYCYWEYCLVDEDPTFSKFWRKESVLELVPDYELDAIKYNL